MGLASVIINGVRSSPLLFLWSYSSGLIQRADTAASTSFVITSISVTRFLGEVGTENVGSG